MESKVSLSAYLVADCVVVEAPVRHLHLGTVINGSRVEHGNVLKSHAGVTSHRSAWTSLGLTVHVDNVMQESNRVPGIKVDPKTLGRVVEIRASILP